MCGLNGFNFSDPDLIVRMNEVTRHRGPDHSDVWVTDNMSLGHNRLSIIDLSADAHQPMRDHHGNVIVYNGEIYNFKELKKQLEAECSFRTQSDTEVILAAYQKWGRSCVKHFNGIFAFALWDHKDQSLMLARDFAGVKPLYYAWKDQKLIFSSELKAILEHPIPRQINRQAFELYMRLQYVPEPLTMIEGLHKLPLGCTAILKGQQLKIESYSGVMVHQSEKRHRQDAPHELRHLFEETVKRQLISDRPVGIFLSGGIDSSAVLDCAAKAQSKIKTFSVAFELNDLSENQKFNSDTLLAKETSRHYGASHHEFVLGPDEVLDQLESTIWHLDEPIANPTVLAQRCLARQAKQEVAVVLGGDGGDELFGGYQRHRFNLIMDHYQKIPSPLRSMLSVFDRLEKLNTPPGLPRLQRFMFQNDENLAMVLDPEFLKPDLSGVQAFNLFESSDNSTERLMDFDRRSWLVDEALMRADKMSMAAGLEQRVPFLDKEMIAFSASLKLNEKVDCWQTKKVMRQAFQGHLPDFLFKQPKRGWFTPAAKWIRHPQIQAQVKNILDQDYHPPTAELFNWPGVKDCLSQHIQKQKYNLQVLWGMVTFQIWAKAYQISDFR